MCCWWLWNLAVSFSLSLSFFFCCHYSALWFCVVSILVNPWSYGGFMVVLWWMYKMTLAVLTLLYTYWFDPVSLSVPWHFAFLSFFPFLSSYSSLLFSSLLFFAVLRSQYLFIKREHSENILLHKMKIRTVAKGCEGRENLFLFCRGSDNDEKSRRIKLRESRLCRSAVRVWTRTLAERA